MATILCEPGSCPNDKNFGHDNYYGCVPKDFRPSNGTSKSYRQRRVGDRWYWNGGCDLLAVSNTETDDTGVRRSG